ncbi:Uncharacterised protein [Mycobacterium tuberculosis]|uniref:Uncharacterized protein n=2 Tax=Mycobacterium tuberculosis TaxID=1773 RepID=A0A916LF66_MYCTX|nr:Uncharacterised protein [Mycobacterium tuberculosis]COX84556.1 Uncharacterised protein [Mycobacterium tuberculosis]COZ88755.1 Uncharacterised protein [Mycobacterium tuberculosis]SGO83974.1 Uncharacterised protein [Mycobacterium tuberculosis]
MSPGRMSGVAFCRSSAVTIPHLPFGIETTTPVPKKALSGISSRNGVPSTTCAGASMWVPECMTVVIFWVSTRLLAMPWSRSICTSSKYGQAGAPCPQGWDRS